MAKKGQKFKKYNQEFIDTLVKLKKEGKTYRYLSETYDVSEGTINTWVHINKHRGNNIRKKKGLSKLPKNQTIEELRIENEILKKYQAFLNQRQEEK